MITLKTEDEIELLRAANLLVGKTLAELPELLPGNSTHLLRLLFATMGQFLLSKVFPIPMVLNFPAAFALL